MLQDWLCTKHSRIDSQCSVITYICTCSSVHCHFQIYPNEPPLTPDIRYPEISSAYTPPRFHCGWAAGREFKNSSTPLRRHHCFLTFFLIACFFFTCLVLLRIILIAKMSQKDDLAYGGYYQAERGSGDGSRGLGDTFKKLRDTYKSHSSSQSGQANQTYNPSGYQGVSFTDSQHRIYSLTPFSAAELPNSKRAAIRTESTEPIYKWTEPKP